MDNYIENSFIIDLSNARDTLEIIRELINILETAETNEKNICLKLRDVELSQAQLLSIKALITSAGATLAFIDINTERTIESAKELGIIISTVKSNLEVNIEEKSSEDNKDQAQIPEFMNEEKAQTECKISEVPDVSELFPQSSKPQSFETEVSTPVAPSELSYEIFKTEEISEEKNSELPTLYLKQTLRSGQTLSYDGNILVIGDTHPGSELIAKGDITVWGVLAGIAHAGTGGDKSARIRALKLNAIQLRIAGIYAGRSNTENIPYIQRSNEFTPQEARIENDILVVRSINTEL